ncbi:MAG: hypothetical protein VKQ33_00310 [Candidatus Sericytochromatia bacterium]|nr:hypothetical protein [Candidatus Sericytochromatia bacterium]
MSPHPPRHVLALTVLGLVALPGCDRLVALAPLLTTVTACGVAVGPRDVVRLAEGPAIFVDAVRVVVDEVSRQAQAVGRGLQGGVSLDGQALAALGPYAWQGEGAYRRAAGEGRSFSLRFTYGEGVPGKAPGAPLEADLTRLDSYVPDALALLNPAGARGPLFPLVQAAGLTGGTLAFRDEALRLAVGSTAATTLEGYALQLTVSTKPLTAGGLVRALGTREVALDLRDTALRDPARGFALTLKRFDLTVGLDGTTRLGGDYMVEVASGALRYVGAVSTAAGQARLSLRCTEDAESEFAAVTWTEGRPELSWRGGRSPLTLPSLGPAQPDAR